MVRKMFRNRSGTAEIVGTVLFLVILFFFFSNVFLWHNQVVKEMDSVTADKMNSSLKMETMVLGGAPVYSSSEDLMVGTAEGQGQYSYPYDPESTSALDGSCRIIQEALDIYGSWSVDVNYTFDTRIYTPAKLRLISAVRLSLYASYTDKLNEACFVYVLDALNNAWMNTGLMVMNGFRWSNTTLSLPSSYIDGEGDVKIRFVDASSQLGFNDTDPGKLYIDYMEVCADPVALKVTDSGGSDATLSRLWIVNATQTADVQTDHMYAELNNTLVAGGSTRTIIFNIETALTADNDSLVVNYVPPAGETVIFRVLTTLGNTAACSIDFPD
jgi:hypothetical protein